MAAARVPVIVAVLCLASAGYLDASSPSLADARSDISNLRFDQAESELLSLVRSEGGERRLEALYLLAGLKRSAAEAEILYQEVIDSDPGGSWGARAALSMAKIRYATGDYLGALALLEGASLCPRWEEACLFQGLCALMSGDYEAARSSFSQIKRGRYRVWAELGLAELEAKENKLVEACRRYQELAQTMISPVALYRYGECLEGEGKGEEARVCFQNLWKNFRESPEAVRAAEKLKVLEQGKEQEKEQTPARPPAGAFTIQLASFADRANALKFAAEVKKVLPGVRIDTDLVGYRELHRVRYGYFPNSEEAQAKAEELRSLLGSEVLVTRIE